MARAHVQGHGPEFPGPGPRGGRLAALVAAADADLGIAAPARARVEWKRAGEDALEISLWALGSDRPLTLPLDAPIKWIVLGGRLATPVVVVGPGPEGKFEPGLLARAGAVELILPPGTNPADPAGKSVAWLAIGGKPNDVGRPPKPPIPPTR